MKIKTQIKIHPQLIYKIWEAQDKEYENHKPESVSEILRKARNELEDKR